VTSNFVLKQTMQKELEELWSQLAVPDSYEPLGVPARPASSCKRQPASFGDRILGSAAGGDWDSRFREQAPNPKHQRVALSKRSQPRDVLDQQGLVAR
jgi:hypothetical protein